MREVKEVKEDKEDEEDKEDQELVSAYTPDCIADFAISPKWSALPAEHHRVKRSVSQPYCLKGDEDVKFCFFYRGKETSESVGADFIAVLSRPPHKLSKEEYETIEVVIRHMSEDDFFQRDNVETRMLSGRMVLQVEGVWKASKVKNYGIFVPGNSSGTLIDEIHYYAPVDRYDQHLSEGLELLQSIKFANGERRAP